MVFYVSPAGRAKAPDFTAPDLDGDLVHLYEIVGGRLTCLVWWDVDSVASIDQLDEMQPMYDTLAPRGLQLLAITCTGPEREQEVRDLVAAKGWTFSVLLDSARSTSGPYAIRGAPTSYLVAADTAGAYDLGGWGDLQRAWLTEFIRFYMPE
jgi:peroxiredoxin